MHTIAPFTATKVPKKTNFKFCLQLCLVVAVVYPWCELRAQDVPSLKQRLQDLVSGSTSNNRLRDNNDVKLWDGKASDFFDDNIQRELCDVISNRNMERLDDLLASENIDLNQQGKHGMTCVYWAYLEGNLQAFVKLLEHGASPDIPLTKELRRSREARAKGISASHVKGLGVLVHAYRNRSERPNFFSLGIEYTKQPNQRDYFGGTFAHNCVANMMSRSQLHLLTRIIHTGVDLDAKTKQGETACHTAVRHNPDSLLLLLWAGADPDIPLPDGTDLIDVVRVKANPVNNPLSAHYQVVFFWLELHQQTVMMNEKKKGEAESRDASDC